MSATTTNVLPEPGNPWLSLAGIVLPGAGHWLLGERTKAIAICAIIHVIVIAAFLGGAAVAPPEAPEPMFTSGLSQSDPIGNTMRFLENLAQRSNGVSVWATRFFGYNQPFTGTFTNAYVTNLLSLGGILNLLATFFLFDDRRAAVRADKEALKAAASAKGKKR